MEKLLISACLLGISSRYDGKSKQVIDANTLQRLSEKYQLVPFCPEIYGGLPTPRVPSERIGDRVMMKDGTDVTENYAKGADEASLLCSLLGIRRALLKQRSPSCGKGEIYDGSFTEKLVSGNGVTAERLLSMGVSVYTEEDVPLLLDE